MTKQSPLVSQINRTNGQLKALSRSLQAKKPCNQIINQFLAIRAGLNRAGMLILSQEFERCSLKDKKKLSNLLNNLLKINK